MFPQRSELINSRMFEIFAKQFIAMLYVPSYLIGTAFAKIVSGRTHTKIAEKEMAPRFLATASTDIMQLYNTYGPIIPIPKWLEDEFPNFYAFMTTDLFHDDDMKTKFFHKSIREKELEETDHMTSNIPNFVYVLFFMSGLYYNFEITEDWKDEVVKDKHILSPAYHRYLPFLQITNGGKLQEQAFTDHKLYELFQLQWIILPFEKAKKSAKGNDKSTSKEDENNVVEETTGDGKKDQRLDYRTYSIGELASLFFDEKETNGNSDIFLLESNFDERIKNIMKEDVFNNFSKPYECVTKMFGSKSQSIVIKHVVFGIYEESFTNSIEASLAAKSKGKNNKTSKKKQGMYSIPQKEFQHFKQSIKMEDIGEEIPQEELKDAESDESYKDSPPKSGTRKGKKRKAKSMGTREELTKKYFDMKASHQAILNTAKVNFEKTIRALTSHTIATIKNKDFTNKDLNALNAKEEKIFPSCNEEIFSRLQQSIQGQTSLFLESVNHDEESVLEIVKQCFDPMKAKASIFDNDEDSVSEQASKRQKTSESLQPVHSSDEEEAQFSGDDVDAKKPSSNTDELDAIPNSDEEEAQVSDKV